MGPEPNFGGDRCQPLILFGCTRHDFEIKFLFKNILQVFIMFYLVSQFITRKSFSFPEITSPLFFFPF